MTYLRDAADFDSHVVGQLYKGDQVERLDIRETGWWRVRSGRTGQAGWVPAELLSPNPVPVVYVYVTQTVSLRECPKDFCPALQMLSRGDQVQKVEQNDQGWWRVLVAKSRNLGWLPAKVVAEQSGKAPGQGAGTSILFCGGETPDAAPGAAGSTPKPSRCCNLMTRWKNWSRTRGWVKVRQPASGAIGWVPERFLGTTPLKFPRFEKPRKKKPQPPKPADGKTPLEPEIM